MISELASFVWGPFCLIPLLVGTGIYLSFRLKFLQLHGLTKAFQLVFSNTDREPGEISPFRALMAALSATIGTGNIVGVAAAILLGGPGAVFWMWLTAFFGMASKYTSCMLAVKYRRIDSKGVVHGGPMYYIEQGLGEKFRWLAIMFAAFTALASFGIGNMFQVNNIVSSLNLLIAGADSAISPVFSFTVGIIAALLVGMVIIGGIRRIALLTGYLVPFMCLLYLGGGLIILLKNYHLVPAGFKLIFTHAFHAPEAISGGILGGVIRQGVARGLFSNEAGMGSAAFAHGAAKTNEPVEEGLVAMLGPLVDTLIVCTLTALVIICTGTYETVTTKGQLTAQSFEAGLPGSGWIVAVGTILFAFSTLISWSYYGDRSCDYLFGEKAVKPYRILYVIAIVVGACLKFGVVIDFCDAMNGLMSIPNLIALIVLTPMVSKLTMEYFRKKRSE